MGDPKKQRKKYRTPSHPWQKDRLDEELRLAGEYGLRNKREIWRLKTMLSHYRSRARKLLAIPAEQRKQKEDELIRQLYKLGVLEENATLDDVLNLTVEDFLKRRLQTVVYERGIAKTVHQARQMITHRHIIVNGRVVTAPSYLVKRNDVIELHPRSPYIRLQKMVEEALKEGEMEEIPEGEENA
ncbi:MAG: 30S ribosomal protein S4 [Candidatus Njordarchaeia archaeon]